VLKMDKRALAVALVRDFNRRYLRLNSHRGLMISIPGFQELESPSKFTTIRKLEYMVELCRREPAQKERIVNRYNLPENDSVW
jgi:hypothetical protein